MSLETVLTGEPPSNGFAAELELGAVVDTEHALVRSQPGSCGVHMSAHHVGGLHALVAEEAIRGLELSAVAERFRQAQLRVAREGHSHELDPCIKPSVADIDAGELVENGRRAVL